MSWPWWLQLALDVLLLAALGFLLWRLRGARGQDRPATPADLKRFVSEATRLSQEFDRLLAEKRELVGTTLKTLDDRIAHLQAMASQLRNPPRPQAPPRAEEQAPPAGETTARDFRTRVRELAGQGRTPQEIAEATGRPRGEVELVLGLSGQH